MDEVEQLERAAELADRLASADTRVKLWHAQNACWRLREKALPKLRDLSAAGDESATRAVAALISLCQSVKVTVPDESKTLTSDAADLE